MLLDKLHSLFWFSNVSGYLSAESTFSISSYSLLLFPVPNMVENFLKTYYLCGELNNKSKLHNTPLEN